MAVWVAVAAVVAPLAFTGNCTAIPITTYSAVRMDRPSFPHFSAASLNFPIKTYFFVPKKLRFLVAFHRHKKCVRLWEGVQIRAAQEHRPIDYVFRPLYGR